MSQRTVLWAFEQVLPAAQKIVLLAIADGCNSDGYGFPGLDRIVAYCTPMKLRMVQRHIRALEANRLVNRVARFEKFGRQSSNGYQLGMPGIDTTGWGEGVQNDILQQGGEGVQSDTLPLSQLVHPPPVIASTPSNSTLNLRVEPKSLTLVRLPPNDGDGLWSQAEELLGFLNDRTGRHFAARHEQGDPTTSLGRVHALLVRGYSLEVIRQVIRDRVMLWGADPRMREFLRPKTLFAEENFEQYAGQVSVSPVSSRARPVPTSAGVPMPEDVREKLRGVFNTG